MPPISSRTCILLLLKYASPVAGTLALSPLDSAQQPELQLLPHRPAALAEIGCQDDHLKSTCAGSCSNIRIDCDTLYNRWETAWYPRPRQSAEYATVTLRGPSLVTLIYNIDPSGEEAWLEFRGVRYYGLSHELHDLGPRFVIPEGETETLTWKTIARQSQNQERWRFFSGYLERVDWPQDDAFALARPGANSCNSSSFTPMTADLCFQIGSSFTPLIASGDMQIRTPMGCSIGNAANFNGALVVLFNSYEQAVNTDRYQLICTKDEVSPYHLPDLYGGDRADINISRQPGGHWLITRSLWQGFAGREWAEIMLTGPGRLHGHAAIPGHGLEVHPGPCDTSGNGIECPTLTTFHGKVKVDMLLPAGLHRIRWHTQEWEEECSCCGWTLAWSPSGVGGETPHGPPADCDLSEWTDFPDQGENAGWPELLMWCGICCGGCCCLCQLVSHCQQRQPLRSVGEPQQQVAAPPLVDSPRADHLEAGAVGVDMQIPDAWAHFTSGNGAAIPASVQQHVSQWQQQPQQPQLAPQWQQQPQPQLAPQWQQQPQQHVSQGRTIMEMPSAWNFN